MGHWPERLTGDSGGGRKLPEDMEIKSLGLLWAPFLSVVSDTSLGDKAQTKGPDTGVTGSSQALDISGALVGQFFHTVLHGTDAHVDTRYGEGPKHEAAVEAVPPCRTTRSTGLRRLAQPPTTTQGCSPCPVQPAGRSPLQRHCSSTRGCGGSCGAVGGPRVSLNHSVMLVWSAQYPALPSHPHPKFGGTLTGEIWLSVNRGGSSGFFSSSGSYSISAPQWAGYFCNSGEDNVLRIYRVFLKTL